MEQGNTKQVSLLIFLTFKLRWIGIKEIRINVEYKEIKELWPNINKDDIIMDGSWIEFEFDKI